MFYRWPKVFHFYTMMLSYYIVIYVLIILLLIKKALGKYSDSIIAFIVTVERKLWYVWILEIVYSWCSYYKQIITQQTRWPNIEYAMAVHALAQPNLDYLAPESGQSGKLLASSDIFSFGMLIYALYNKCQPFSHSNSNYTTYGQSVSKLKRISNSDLLSIPQDIRDIVKLMLNITPELRPDLHEFLKVTSDILAGKKSEQL